MDLDVLLFDFGGTLDSDGIYWFDFFHEACQRQGVSLPRPDFEEVARTAGRRIYNHPDIRSLSHPQTVLRLMEELGHILRPRFPMDPPSIADEFLRVCQPWLEANRDVLRTLSRQFRLGVLSNNWGNAAGWCAEYGYEPYLEVVVDSGVEKVSKPDPRIFEIALERMGVPASRRVAYVGDRFHTDMVGARRAGLSTVWIRHRLSNESGEDGVVDRVIGSLPEILQVVEVREPTDGAGCGPDTPATRSGRSAERRRDGLTPEESRPRTPGRREGS